MSKKSQPKPAKKQSPRTYQPHEDFFTKFIDKRQKHLIQKLEEISVLEKTSESILKPDQKEKINSKNTTLERVKYFEGIKELYFEAYAKKSVSNADNKSTSTSEIDEVISSIADFLKVGQAIKNFEENSKYFEHAFNSDQMVSILDVHNSITKQESIESLEESKLKLKNYIVNKNFKESIAKFMKNFKVESDAAKSVNQTVAVTKSKLFECESEE